MATPLQTTGDTLRRIQTELTVVRAQRADLQWKVRQRQLIERVRLKDATIRRALRVRDHLTSAGARQAPLLAAEFDLPMEQLHGALADFMDFTLRWISAREFAGGPAAPEPAQAKGGTPDEVPPSA